MYLLALVVPVDIFQVLKTMHFIIEVQISLFVNTMATGSESLLCPGNKNIFVVMN